MAHKKNKIGTELPKFTDNYLNLLVPSKFTIHAFSHVCIPPSPCDKKYILTKPFDHLIYE